MSRPQHDYHLVDPSPWPVVGALSGFLLCLGAVAYFRPDSMNIPPSVGAWTLAPGLILTLATMFGWWRDVLKESRSGHHKPVVQLGFRYGMTLFIASEVMFFVAFFWAYFDAALFPADTFARVEQFGGVWPPEGIETVSAFEVPFINTLLLLLSGVTVTWAHHAIIEENQTDTVKALGLTVALGIVFLAFQAYEYWEAHFGLSSTMYGSTFFMATGFHGFHVLLGTIFLTVALIRAARHDFTADRHFGFEAAAWYWHFVDVVWLFLFVSIYWWGNGTV